MNEELTLLRGNTPSFADRIISSLKSKALVSSGPIICSPLSGSPLNGTDTGAIICDNSLTYVAGRISRGLSDDAILS